MHACMHADAKWWLHQTCMCTHAGPGLRACPAARRTCCGGVLPPDLAPAVIELAPYLADSFGNATRIDYGTGHETNFCVLLCCLAKLGVLVESDLQARAFSPCSQLCSWRCASALCQPACAASHWYVMLHGDSPSLNAQALVTRVCVEYISLMRKVQTTYWCGSVTTLLRSTYCCSLQQSGPHLSTFCGVPGCAALAQWRCQRAPWSGSVLDVVCLAPDRLEPAGSHGVWGLDDYQFLPFVWGAAQLVHHPFIRPGSIHSQEVLDAGADDYLYLSCVRFVKQVRACAAFPSPFPPFPCTSAGLLCCLATGG